MWVVYDEIGVGRKPSLSESNGAILMIRRWFVVAQSCVCEAIRKHKWYWFRMFDIP